MEYCTTYEGPFQPASTVTVKGWRGIAFYVDGVKLEPADFEESEFGIMYDPDMIEDPDIRVCHMVGDDTLYAFDVDDLTLLPEDEFCCGCGQIGCGWG